MFLDNECVEKKSYTKKGWCFFSTDAYHLVEIEEVDLFDLWCFCMDELRRTDAVRSHRWKDS